VESVGVPLCGTLLLMPGNECDVVGLGGEFLFVLQRNRLWGALCCELLL
jgi:hypothetical protein